MMKAMARIIATRLRPKPRSCREALRRLFGEDNLERTYAECQDRRLLLSKLADKAEISEAQLGAQVADMLGIEYLEHVEPMDFCALQPNTLTFSELR